ncbi:hypothetical protein [Thiolapillus sp.]|uniref:hypothetical protein n=1 Tax=Thiolapillus sp. TaxID=2017437 RepID=UPI003AF974B2
MMMFAIVPRETSSRPYACWPAGLLASMPGFLPAAFLTICRFTGFCQSSASVALSLCDRSAGPRCLASLLAGWLVALLFCRFAGFAACALVYWAIAARPCFFVCLRLLVCLWWSHCHLTVDCAASPFHVYLLFLLPPIFILGSPS